MARRRLGHLPSEAPGPRNSSAALRLLRGQNRRGSGKSRNAPMFRALRPNRQRPGRDARKAEAERLRIARKREE